MNYIIALTRLLTNFPNKLAAAAFALLAFPVGSSAADLTLRPRPRLAPVLACNDFVLSCENGHSYQFCPHAISERGDVVTGTLILGPYHGVHMRLIPMGVGYRYAGPGIWFEGYKSDAVLSVGHYGSIACTVSRTGFDP